MKRDVQKTAFLYGNIIALAFLLSSCSGSRVMQMDKVSANNSVRIFLATGENLEGLVLERDATSLTVVAEQDRGRHVIATTDIRRIEQSDKHYDIHANPISNAEIEKYKSNRNSWVYAMGGAAISGLVGIAIGIPIWIAADNPPPFFVGGLAAVGGSLYFGARGISKDRDDAVAKVRFLREHEEGLESERDEEQQRLEALRTEKANLMKQLKEKKDQEDSPE